MDFEYGYKYLLDLLIGLILIVINLSYQPANAKDLTYLSTLNNKSNKTSGTKVSLGVDFIYLDAKSNGDYKDIFHQNRPGGNLYIGYNLNGIMLETGYSFTTRRAKEVLIPDGSSFLDLPVTPNTIFNAKVRFKNTHVTLNFFTDFCKNLKIITAIGVGFVRPNTIFVNYNPITGRPTTYAGTIATKTTMVPRAGIGLNLLHNSVISLRGMFYVEQYSKIRYKTAPTPNTSKPFKNAYTLLIGLLFKI